MTERRTQLGPTVKLHVEVGPWISHGFGKADIARMDRRMRDDIDRLIRGYVNVGKRSKFVRTSLEEA